MWSTDQPLPAIVTWQADPDSPQQATVAPAAWSTSQPAEIVGSLGYVYETRLVGLSPGTSYRYEVRLEEHTAVGSFRTSPASPEPFTFVLYGDNRTDHAKAREMADLVAGQDAAFILHTGDLVQTGKFEEYKAHYFDPLAGLIGRMPVLPALGNHEGDGVAFRRLFALPGNERYYSWDYANTHFVVLCTRGAAQNRPLMLDWLDRDLAASTADWKIVVYHEPSYDVAPRHTAWGRKDILPLLRKHKVDLVAAGHSHGYQRLVPMYVPGENDEHPITFMVTAGGGAPLHRIEQSPFAAKAVSDYHFVRFTIDHSTLSAQAIDRAGREIDRFQIAKRNGKLDTAYLAAAKPEADFSIVHDAVFDTMKGIVLSRVPQPGEPAEAQFGLGAGPFGMTFRLTLGGGGHYVMEPKEICGRCEPNATVPVSATIRAKGRTETRGTALDPDVQFVCEYEIDGRKGSTYGGSLRWRAPPASQPDSNRKPTDD